MTRDAKTYRRLASTTVLAVSLAAAIVLAFSILMVLRWLYARQVAVETIGFLFGEGVLWLSGGLTFLAVVVLVGIGNFLKRFLMR